MSRVGPGRDAGEDRDRPDRDEPARRLAAVFGDVLPEATGDDRDETEERGADEWLRRQVPPHHH